MDQLIPFFQNVSGGLLIGGIYALMGVGLALIFGVMRIINFAHGEFVAVGMYLAIFLFRSFGMDPYVSLLIALPGGFLLGVLLEKLVLSRLVDVGGDSTLLATLGLGLVLSNILFLIFGAEPASIYLPYATTSIDLFGVRLPIAQLLAFAVTVVALAALYFFLNRTETGRAIRATSQNRTGAELVGVNTKRIHGLVFGIGVALAITAGVVLSPLLFAIPTVGHTYTLKAFVIIVLGGMGSIPGAIVGGLLLGLVEFLGASYLSAGYRDAYGLIAFLLVLLLRPQGLFGKSVRRV